MTTHAQRMKEIDTYCDLNPHGAKHCYCVHIVSSAGTKDICCWCGHLEPKTTTPDHGPFAQ